MSFWSRLWMRRSRHNISHFLLLLRLFGIARRLDARLSRGLPFLWSTSLPSPLLTRPIDSSVALAALRLARFFFCAGFEW